MLILHQVNTWFSGEVAFPGRIEKEASRRTRNERRVRGEFAVCAQQLALFRHRSLCNIPAPRDRQLQAAVQMSKCVDSLLVGTFEQLCKDSSRDPGITQRTVTVRYGNAQV